MTGPACGNNPNYRMSDGDRQAVDSFRAYLATLASLRTAQHRLDQIRDAARLHRQQLVGTSELYAVIEADDVPPADHDDVAARTLASLEKVTERARRAEAEAKWLRTMYAASEARVSDLIDERDQLLETRTAPAAVLRKAADAVFALEYDVMVGEEGDENMGSMREAWDVGTIHATQLLRRMADQAEVELRRVADETAATETEADVDTVANRAAQVISGMGAEIRELRSQRDRYRTAWHSARGRTSRAKDARDYWHYELRSADARILELERKLRPAAECPCAVLRTGPGRHLPECPNGPSAGARQDGAQR